MSSTLHFATPNFYQICSACTCLSSESARETQTFVPIPIVIHLLLSIEGHLSSRESIEQHQLVVALTNIPSALARKHLACRTIQSISQNCGSSCFILKSTECQGNGSKNMQVRALSLDQRTSMTVHNLVAACDALSAITIHSSSVGRSRFDVYVARIERSLSQSRPLQSRDTCRPCNFISKAWTHSRHLLRDVDQYTFPLSACRVDSLDQFQLNSLAKTASLLGHHHFHLIEDSNESTTSSSLEHFGRRMKCYPHLSQRKFTPLKIISISLIIILLAGCVPVKVWASCVKTKLFLFPLRERPSAVDFDTWFDSALMYSNRSHISSNQTFVLSFQPNSCTT